MMARTTRTTSTSFDASINIDTIHYNYSSWHAMQNNSMASPLRSSNRNEIVWVKTTFKHIAKGNFQCREPWQRRATSSSVEGVRLEVAVRQRYADRPQRNGLPKHMLAAELHIDKHTNRARKTLRTRVSSGSLNAQPVTPGTTHNPKAYKRLLSLSEPLPCVLMLNSPSHQTNSYNL